jgi:alpha-mannosidase
MRFYEFAGKNTEVPLKLIHGARSASETDLMERKTAALSPRNGTVFVHARPYEIKTVTIVPLSR